MKRRGFAALIAATLLCTALAGCNAGYADDAVYQAHGDDVANLAHNCSAVQRLSEKKEKSASKAVDGKLDTACTVNGTSGTIEIDLGGEQTFNTIVLREKGWNIQKYHLDAFGRDETGKEAWHTIYVGDRIEDLRYCALEKDVTASKLRLTVDTASQAFSIREIEVTRPAQVKTDDFRVTAYVSNECLLEGTLFEPDSGTYLDPAYCDVVTELNLLRCVTMTKEGDIIIRREVTGEDGKKTAETIPDAEFAAALDRLRGVIGNRDIQLTMTIETGAHEDALAAMTEHRDTLIQNTLAFAEKFGLDGISYDWERPQNKEQFDAFSDYLITLKPQLAAKNLRLTLAWAAWGVNMKEEAVKTADAIEIMSYDLFDQYGNQASFLESTVQAVDYFTGLGYDLKQLNIGIPYYGRPEDGGEYWPSYNDARYSFGRYDDTDSEYVASYGKCYFNGYQTVMDKTAYAISRGVGGVMLFRLELDRPFEDDVCLTKAIGRTVTQRIAQGN